MPNRVNKVDKAKDFKASIKKLFSSLRPYLFMIVIAIVLIIISTVCTCLLYTSDAADEL